MWKGSECRDGYCSNPFEKGCLHALLNNAPEDDFGSLSKETRDRLAGLIQRLKSQVRVCNSDDLPEAEAQGICISHSRTNYNTGESNSNHKLQQQRNELYADYKEIRVHTQNWESSYYSAWIVQILLGEILQVPATVESGTMELSQQNNFYDPQARLGYGTSSDWGAFRAASQAKGADCAKVQQDIKTNGEDYQSCAHAAVEYWNGNTVDYEANLKEGNVEPLQSLGGIGQQGIFVTKFTAEEDPTILNLLGIQGDQNRRKLAEMFKRPTTWKEYCEISNCTIPNEVAQRPPLDASEQDRMHVPGLYTGHFRATVQNNCDRNPTSCTGHIGDFPCGWVSFVGPQIYHNNIALRSDGKDSNSSGYTYQQLSDMWAAANATRSNLMTMWWTPEAMHQASLGTESEMQKITLTWPTQKCFENRVSSRSRCLYEDPVERYGDAAGSCDEAPQLLHKVVATNLYSAIYDSGIPEAMRSPAYDAIQAYKITELQYGEILAAWISREKDKYGFDPRMATCQWVLENLDQVVSYIPRSYPRVAVQKEFYGDPLNIAAVVFSCLALAVTLSSAILTYLWRESSAIVFAQVEFLFLLLIGLVMVACGALTIATEPNSVSCNVSLFMILLGYTIQFVPLILKVAAIHKLVAAAERLRRVELPKTQLFGSVAFITGVVLVYLICWTAFDPRRPYNDFILTKEVDQDGQTVVTMDPYCSSSSGVWQIVNSLWFVFLMVCMTVLAFMTRHTRAEFNESKALGFMVYSHFLFLVLLVATILLNGALPGSYLIALRSLLYSADVITTLLIYFLPKFATRNEPAGRRISRWESQTGVSNFHGNSSLQHNVINIDGAMNINGDTSNGNNVNGNNSNGNGNNTNNINRDNSESTSTSHGSGDASKPTHGSSSGGHLRNIPEQVNDEV